MNMIFLGFVLIVGFFLVVKLIKSRTSKSKFKTLKADDTPDISDAHLQKLKILRDRLELTRYFEQKYSELCDLKDWYFTEDKEEYFTEKHRHIKNIINNEIETSVDHDNLLEKFREYKALIKELDQVVSSPEKHMVGKFYDPFTGDVLEKDAVALALKHPTYGALLIKVNKKTAERYNSKGSKGFNLKSFNKRSPQKYMVKSYNSSIDTYYDNYYYDDDGFGVFDYMIFHNLFCNGYGPDVCINDIGFVPGEAGECFSSDVVYYENTEISAETYNEDVPVVDNNIIPEECSDPVIDDPFNNNDTCTDQSQDHEELSTQNNEEVVFDNNTSSDDNSTSY